MAFAQKMKDCEGTRQREEARLGWVGGGGWGEMRERERERERERGGGSG